MKKFISELIGTFLLVLCGTGSVIVDSQSNSLGLLGISAVFGIIIIAMIYSFGHISGTHINPAVSISLAAINKIPKKELFIYVPAQIIGALLASGTLYILFPETKTMGETVPTGSVMQSFAIEFILTFILMITILGVTSKQEFGNIAGIVIGTLVIGLILFAGPISGGSFNPARSLAPALFSGGEALSNLWLYLLSPTLGAITAGFVWKFIND